MANVDTGYNAERINELIEELKKGYNDVGETLTGSWPSVQNTLRDNWIGEDEQSYEQAFVKRLDEMYLSAAELVNTVIAQFKGLGDAWYEFQQNNVLGGADKIVSSPITINETTVEEITELIHFDELTFGNDADRGVKAGAEGAISTSIGSFVDAVKSGVQGIVNGVDASNAFIGSQQSGAIDTYLEHLNSALASILTAVADINEAVATLAGSQYSESESTVASTMGESTIEEDVNSKLGEMKWGS